jgi:hypothetical protein
VVLGFSGIWLLEIVMACSGIDRGGDSRRLAAADLPLPHWSLSWEIGGANLVLGRVHGPGWEGVHGWWLGLNSISPPADQPLPCKVFFSPLARFWRLSGGHLDPAISGMTDCQHITSY